MDQATYLYILLGLVVVLLIIKRPLQRYLNAKAADAGRKAGAAVGEKLENSKLVTATNDMAALALYVAEGGFDVAQRALASAKSVTPISPTEWNLRFVEPNDVTFVWVSLPEGGGQFQIVRTVDLADGPVGGPQWRKLLRNVEKVLTQAGVQFERRQLPSLVKVSESPVLWGPAAG